MTDSLSIPEAKLSLEEHLVSRRASGAKLLVPYITAGYSKEWLETVVAIAEAGADAIEIGVPFSDPIMDGPVIQAASQAALERGVTPASAMAELATIDVGVPLVVMTYCNLAFHAGFSRFAGWLKGARVTGTIFPDLPLEEAGEWAAVAAEVDIANILLVSPTTPAERAARIARASRGFVYGVGLMGVTGVRSSLAETASSIATSLKAATDRVVLVGVGISTPDQASEVATHSDGVVVGSALVKRLNEGVGPNGAYEFVASLRAALDSIPAS